MFLSCPCAFIIRVYGHAHYHGYGQRYINLCPDAKSIAQHCILSFPISGLVPTMTYKDFVCNGCNTPRNRKAEYAMLAVSPQRETTLNCAADVCNTERNFYDHPVGLIIVKNCGSWLRSCKTVDCFVATRGRVYNVAQPRKVPHSTLSPSA